MRTETDEPEAPTLGEQLLASATYTRERAATQALVEEETILALDSVRRLLVVESEDGPACDWERLMGRLYGLGLDEEQRAFLGLVLGMTGIGLHTLSTVEKLDERRLLILMRAMPTLAGNDRIAVGTRIEPPLPAATPTAPVAGRRRSAPGSPVGADRSPYEPIKADADGVGEEDG